MDIEDWYNKKDKCEVEIRKVGTCYCGRKGTYVVADFKDFDTRIVCDVCIGSIRENLEQRKLKKEDYSGMKG